MAEIIGITSEALQAKIRQLLPSQQGFGEDLQASNVVLPIVDLTETAEGSEVRSDLQTAIAFGSQTTFNVENTSSVIVNTTGFYRIFGVVSIYVANSASFSMSDGLSTKTILSYSGISTDVEQTPFDFVAFFAAGESMSVTSAGAGAIVAGSTRQIATVTGELVNPSGFTPE
jgi:hypothetical protein